MARPKLGDSETERLHIKITADELEAIDDWRFANRVPSRSEAVRRLCQLGLRVATPQLDLLADTIYETSDLVTAATDAWEKLIEDDKDPSSEDDISLHAFEVASLFFEHFPAIIDHVQAVHNRMVDLALELNAIEASASVPEAIRAANEARSAAAQRWREWMAEDDTWTKMGEQMRRNRKMETEE